MAVVYDVNLYMIIIVTQRVVSVKNNLVVLKTSHFIIFQKT